MSAQFAPPAGLANPASLAHLARTLSASSKRSTGGSTASTTSMPAGPSPPPGPYTTQPPPPVLGVYPTSSSSAGPSAPAPSRPPAVPAAPTAASASAETPATAAPMATADEPFEAPFVFLGGSCNPTTWRKTIAIPLLDQCGVSFFNPQTDNWSTEFVALENVAKEGAEVLLFVIDGQTRAIASMLESVELIVRRRRIVVCVENIPDGHQIDGDAVRGRQLTDLNRGRHFLLDIASRNRETCDVFTSIEDAVKHVVALHRAAAQQQQLAQQHAAALAASLALTPASVSVRGPGAGAAGASAAGAASGARLLYMAPETPQRSSIRLQIGTSSGAATPISAPSPLPTGPAGRAAPPRAAAGTWPASTSAAASAATAATVTGVGAPLCVVGTSASGSVTAAAVAAATPVSAAAVVAGGLTPASARSPTSPTPSQTGAAKSFSVEDNFKLMRGCPPASQL